MIWNTYLKMVRNISYRQNHLNLGHPINTVNLKLLTQVPQTHLQVPFAALILKNVKDPELGFG